MSLIDMPTVSKRLLTLCVALALLVGASAQFLPRSMAQTDLSIRADMSAGCVAPMAPCTGHLLGCTDHFCCITAPALPFPPASPLIERRGTSVAYDFAATSLSGLSVEPELAPPILAA